MPFQRHQLTPISMIIEMVRINFLRNQALIFAPLIAMIIVGYVVNFTLIFYDSSLPEEMDINVSFERFLYLPVGGFVYVIAAYAFCAAMTQDDRRDSSVLFWMSLPVPLWMWLTAIFVTLLLGAYLTLTMAILLGSFTRMLVLFFEVPITDVGGNTPFPSWGILWFAFKAGGDYLLWQIPLNLFFLALGSTAIRSPAVIGIGIIVGLVALDIALVGVMMQRETWFLEYILQSFGWFAAVEGVGDEQALLSYEMLDQKAGEMSDGTPLIVLNLIAYGSSILLLYVVIRSRLKAVVSR